MRQVDGSETILKKQFLIRRLDAPFADSTRHDAPRSPETVRCGNDHPRSETTRFEPLGCRCTAASRRIGGDISVR